ncbi:ADP-ribose pyrophosphatase [Nocardia mangyaensis]|uniref:ADP-ribose pyrophosphatase n=1 Tax=Nocardia mangyaensis TaxID=2213200 RepID=A0A1J0VPE7_9NOCA|nr:NUDIX hydrolase [Nocardia mangyaensis]APE33912.1 ADP-ribose pyrophosphatase [Nocardia mangyaensis]
MEQLSSRTIYTNPWLRLREDTVRRADGTVGIYGVLDKLDWSLVIPFDGKGFHLVEQFRYPLGVRCWEFPAGTPPEGTTPTPLEVAHNELREETGLRAGRMVHLGTMATAPAITNQRGHCFLATDLVPGAPEREHEEQDMRTAWFSRARVEAMIMRGEIVDAHTLAAFGMLLMHERSLG